MERIGQADIITILEKLHHELKAQTRDSKLDQHRLLRKSFHYVTATLHKPMAGPASQRNSAQGRKLAEVTHRVLQELFALLVGGDGFAPPRIRILSSALVRELSAGETPYFFRDNFAGNFAQYDHNKVKYFMPVLSELSNSRLLVQNISNLVDWFVGDSDVFGLKTVSLSCLIACIQRFPNVLDKDKHVRVMEDKFRQILTGASLESRKTTSTTLFGVRIVSTSSACNVTEVDGSPTRDFFTCMNNSYDYSEDQILNVHVFSSLYQWIFHLYQAQFLEARKKQSRDDIVTKLEHFGLTHDLDRHGDGQKDSPQSQHLEDSQRLNPVGCFTLDEGFREVVISVCLRILSQVEREVVTESSTTQMMRLGTKSVVISENDWMKEFMEATSMEAVRLLDLLCLMDPALVSCIFPAVKKVYERTVNRQSGLVFSAVLQFFVNHGQHVIFNVDPVLHHFFVDYVSVRYRQQLLAMSTLLFLTTNTSKMLLHTPVFPKYYPAIIKLLAWHPRTVASEVLPLIPAMVGPSTFIELFHTLLDLPLTAAFMEQYDRPEEHLESQWSRLGLDRMSPAFQVVQQYIMRNESRLGGVCIWERRDEAQLSMIRILWNSLPVTPRVSSVCKLVPRFLRVYFDVLLTNAPPACIERIVPLLLQRFASLYPVDFFLKAGHSLIIDTLQAIFQQWPGFLMSLKGEVVHAISKHLDVQGKLLVLHLCWIIGELLSPAMCLECKGDVTIFFEALEMLAYEATLVRADEVEKKRGALRAAPGPLGKTELEMSSDGAKGGAGIGDASGIAMAGSQGMADMGGRVWQDEGSGTEHEEPNTSAGVAGPEAADDDTMDVPPRAERAGEAVFTPRFIAVVIASLTKLGTKFPEFSPRVILCLIKMREHYDADVTEGMEFVRDRLADSLQLLHHSAITSSVYNCQASPGAMLDRFFSFHLSSLSSLSHVSHNAAAFTPGALLHDFELPRQSPKALVASMDGRSGDDRAWVLSRSGAVGLASPWLASETAAFAEPVGDLRSTWGPDCFAELRRAAAASSVPPPTVKVNSAEAGGGESSDTAGERTASANLHSPSLHASLPPQEAFTQVEEETDAATDVQDQADEQGECEEGADPLLATLAHASALTLPPNLLAEGSSPEATECAGRHRSDSLSSSSSTESSPQRDKSGGGEGEASSREQGSRASGSTAAARGPAQVFLASWQC